MVICLTSQNKEKHKIVNDTNKSNTLNNKQRKVMLPTNLLKSEQVIVPINNQTFLFVDIVN